MTLAEIEALVREFFAGTRAEKHGNTLQWAGFLWAIKGDLAALFIVAQCPDHVHTIYERFKNRHRAQAATFYTLPRSGEVTVERVLHETEAEMLQWCGDAHRVITEDGEFQTLARQLSDTPIGPMLAFDHGGSWGTA